MEIPDIVIWIVQGLLGFVFLMAGGMKIATPKEKLIERMGNFTDWDPNLIKLLGAVEVAGAIGIIAPVALDILPFLTPLAGIGLAIVMVGAMLTHLRRKEYPNIAVNTVLLLLAVFVVAGRIEPLAQLFV
ncbi:MAG: DoxX family protein [Aggregatilineales bacterium]